MEWQPLYTTPSGSHTIENGLSALTKEICMCVTTIISSRSYVASLCTRVERALIVPVMSIKYTLILLLIFQLLRKSNFPATFFFIPRCSNSILLGIANSITFLSCTLYGSLRRVENCGIPSGFCRAGQRIQIHKRLNANPRTTVS